MNPPDYRQMLADAAEDVPPSGIDPAQLGSQARRRRKRRNAKVAAGLLGFAATAGSVLLWTEVRGGSGTPITKQRDAPGISCGRPLAPLSTAPGPGGLRLAIDSVAPGKPGGPPVVTVSFSADMALQVGEAGDPKVQVAVLHNGVIVDKIGGSWLPEYAPNDALTNGAQSASLRVWPVTPTAPHTQALASSKWTSCPGAPWNAIWADPQSYQLVAYASLSTMPGAGVGPLPHYPMLIASPLSSLSGWHLDG